MNKALFLDRDGVINRDFLPYQHKLEHFYINDDVFPVLKNLHDKNYLLIIISNQGGIAKGLYSKKDVYVLYDHLNKLAAEYNFQFTDIYFCPHHDMYGRCICRKPDSQMLEKAMARYNVDPHISYFVGDTDRDVQAGLKAGVNTIKVIPNQSLKKIEELIK